MFVAEVTDEFILRLDVLWAYVASVDIERHLLRLGLEEIILWRPGTLPISVRLCLVGDVVIPARCERVVMAKLGAHLGRPTSSLNPVGNPLETKCAKPER